MKRIYVNLDFKLFKILMLNHENDGLKLNIMSQQNKFVCVCVSVCGGERAVLRRVDTIKEAS